jgi:3',5'-nucleoside bisphosphate phosphatase
MKIDLHLHSCFSGDGIHKVNTLVNLYSPGDIIALTDHETIAGWNDFEFACNDRKIKPVFGIEWFCKPFHVLSYFPSRKIPDSFKSFIEERRRKEKVTMKTLADQLKNEDIDFPDYDTLMNKNHHPENILGMMILGCTMHKRKHVLFEDAIKELRGRKRELRGCPEPFYSEEIIERMAKWGAVSILAHPFRRKEITESFLSDFIILVKTYKGAGLNGIELHPFQEEFNIKIIEICKQFDLIWTIGSDYHHYKEGIYPNKLPEPNGTIISGLEKFNLI